MPGPCDDCGPRAARAGRGGGGRPGRALADRDLIKYLVILYPENASFDRYFGLYPVALNPAGEPAFHARPGTPAINGLTETLLLHNPNQSNPFRIARLDSFTCDSNHQYHEECWRETRA